MRKGHWLITLLFLIQVFSWTDNSNNEDGFNFYRQRAGVWTVIGVTAPNISTFTDSTAVAGDCYEVSAFNSVGESVFSNSVCLPLLPSAPTNLQRK